MFKIQYFFLYNKTFLSKVNIYSNFTFMNTIYAKNELKMSQKELFYMQ